DKGMSNVVGALMLTLVVIIAAAGFAAMLSQIQREEMKRATHISAVEGEELRIMSIYPEFNETNLRLERLDVSVLNLNSRDSYLTRVSINDEEADNFTSKIEGVIYTHNSSVKLWIPAKESRLFSVNFTSNYDPDYNISIIKPLEITLSTDYDNFFTRLYTPPTPVIKLLIETEDLGVAERDILVLDGSDSFDDGSILGYHWLASNGTYQVHNITGKKVRMILNQSGPFYVNLTVVDDTKMIGISENIKIPANKNFNPAVSMEASATSYAAGDLIDVTVRDIDGGLVEGVGVSFIRMSGDVTFSPAGDVTNSSGMASTTTNAGTSGIIQIHSGKMNPLAVSVV
ncbi:MAG: hypothetical protein U9Q22_03930, partial [Candidatus Altiarchaeota archaeon]|nr:hypothetical protein [Candidatus Altiarchaeota archaeon]